MKTVALLAEGVGRNPPLLCRMCWGLSSPSSRRAWVEITGGKYGSLSCKVALLAEGVGRNLAVLGDLCGHIMSPSSRRAWVEITVASSRSPFQMSPSSRRAWVEIALGRGYFV